MQDMISFTLNFLALLLLLAIAIFLCVMVFVFFYALSRRSYEPHAREELTQEDMARLTEIIRKPPNLDTNVK
jgi:hypothetical protein